MGIRCIILSFLLLWVCSSGVSQIRLGQIEPAVDSNYVIITDNTGRQVYVPQDSLGTIMSVKQLSVIQEDLTSFTIIWGQDSTLIDFASACGVANYGEVDSLVWDSVGLTLTIYEEGFTYAADLSSLEESMYREYQTGVTIDTVTSAITLPADEADIEVYVNGVSCEKMTTPTFFSSYKILAPNKLIFYEALESTDRVRISVFLD